MATATAPIYTKEPKFVPTASIGGRTKPAAKFPAGVGASGSGAEYCTCGATALGDAALPPARISESGDTLHILLPLCGADLQQVYVIATPRSIVAEIRIKNKVNHPGFALETQEQRITREVRFQFDIKELSTVIRVIRDALEITCTKADHANDRLWSHLVHFDTRASLGCVPYVTDDELPREGI